MSHAVHVWNQTGLSHNVKLSVLKKFFDGAEMGRTLSCWFSFKCVFCRRKGTKCLAEMFSIKSCNFELPSMTTKSVSMSTHIPSYTITIPPPYYGITHQCLYHQNVVVLHAIIFRLPLGEDR